MLDRKFWLVIMIAGLIAGVGCSGSSSDTPLLPQVGSDKGVEGMSNHYTWGLWQFAADPDIGTLDITQLRSGNFHLNALPFLEPPPLVNLTLESLQFNGNIIDADIGLRHPFLGLTEFTGYDVCGILITNGSVTGYADSGLRMAGPGDTRLLNPDGFARWWNPSEFPVNLHTMFSYNDGLLGTPDAVGNYNSTLNAYKYFCDDLTDPDSPMGDVTLEKRGLFSAGQKNIRHYQIELGDDGLVFNYAVDACWEFPAGAPPWKAPDNFGPNANRQEAWRIEVNEVENTLYNDGDTSGGNLSLHVDVYDWFNVEMNTLRVESPGNFAMVESSDIVGGGDGYSTYEIDINDTTPAPGEIELLVSVVSEAEDFGGYIPGVNATSYFTYTAEVGGETPTMYHWELDPGFLIRDNALQDDQSPGLAWEADDQLRVYWTCDTIPAHPDHMHSQDQAMRSDDGGQTWIDYHVYWTHGNAHCEDHVKISGAGNGNSFALHPLATSGGLIDTPFYFAGAATNLDMGYSSGYSMMPYQDCGEIICDVDGYIHTYGDKINGDIYSGIYQQIGNQQWTFWNDYSWWPDPDNIPSKYWWWPLDKVLVTDAPARLSDTRSIGYDDSGTIYLAYWGGPGYRFIKVARTTDYQAALEWESITVTDQTGYTDVRDPGLDIDANGRIHLAFLRHNIATDEDEICYTYSTDSGDSWADIEVVYSSANYLTDTPVVAYEVLDAHVVAIAFEDTVEESTYFVSSFDAGQNWEEPILFGYEGASSDKMPDMIEGTDGKLHFAFSHLDGEDRDLHARNAELVED